MKIHNFNGQFYSNDTYRQLYATDASIYRIVPKAVAFPLCDEDVVTLVNFANNSKIPLIARGAGTSLAGQAIGNGIIVDFSKFMNKIIEINPEQKYCIVQPGVVLSTLNSKLSEFGLFFGPETSTANRVTIGGMLGNNACGLHSLVYGSVRDNLLEVELVLSDGTITTFKNETLQSFQNKLNQNNVEGNVFRTINEIFCNAENVNKVLGVFPPKSLKRRNSGYAIDFIADSELFSQSENPFNLSKLIAGSEGTLAIATKIKLNLVDLPPKNSALVCVHLKNLMDAFWANLIALEYRPSAVELMDETILKLARKNPQQLKNSYFIEGDPQAILMIEFNSNSIEEIQDRISQMTGKMRQNGYGYHFSVLWNKEINLAWDLRKAGLGVLSNLPGDAKPISIIEDTAIDVYKLPYYIDEYNKIIEKYNIQTVYHAHIGTGELHLRPILNIKDSKDLELMKKLAYEVALLVKKYNGSFSGEHGDGIVRSSFLPLIYGEEVYSFFVKIKNAFDPNNILNPGKIVHPYKIDENLRYPVDKEFSEITTYFDFSNTLGFKRAVEKCNGSADCRKSTTVMCPTFQATNDEYFSTRGRANLLREYLNYKSQDLYSKEIYNILNHCLSCKACKNECPSNVDITKIKAEFLQHYYDKKYLPLRTWIIANFPAFNKFFALMPSFFNYFSKTFMFKFFMNILGFEPKRTFPEVSKPLKKIVPKKTNNSSLPRVYFFADEFTNINDANIGIKAIILLEKLGYNVIIPKIEISGRTYLSKGLVRKAKKIIDKNLLILKNIIDENSPLIGIEPSAVLTFRDEALDLAEDKALAYKIANNTYLIEEFIYNEMKKGNITSDMFVENYKKIVFHGHCYQKALSSTKYTKEILSLPKNYKVEEINSGCCGMAGAYGFEKEHYDISVKIANQVLIPKIKSLDEDTILVANGTSCRHQISDLASIQALHPVEVLLDALKN